MASILPLAKAGLSLVPEMVLLANTLSSNRASISLNVKPAGSLELTLTFWKMFLESVTPCSGDPICTVAVVKK